MKKPNNNENLEIIPISNIIQNEYLTFNFINEDIKGIADNIQLTDEIVPPNVIKVGTKFQIFSELPTYEAFKLLGRKEIPVHVIDITEEKAILIGIKAHLSKPDIIPADTEKIFYKLIKSGKFGSNADLSRKLGGKPTPQRIGNLFDAKETREKISEKLKTNVSFVPTEIIIAIKQIPLDLQCEIVESYIQGKIKFKKTMELCDECVKFINSISKDHKKAILDGTIPYDRATYIIESRYKSLFELLDKAKSKLYKKEILQEEVAKDTPLYNADLLIEFVKFIKELEPKYFEDVKDEIEKKQVEQYENIAYALLSRLMLKRNKITQELYEMILKTLSLDNETVEKCRESGHNYGMENEYLTPADKKLREKSRKLDTSKKYLLDLV